MQNFWENLLRYQRFFISSFTGLIVVILEPLIKKFKQGKLELVTTLILIALLIRGIEFVIHIMLNT